MTTDLAMPRTKEQSGQTARQCAIAQRARAPTRTMRHSSTASTAVLMNAAGASATSSPAAATAAWNGDGAAAEAVDIRVL